MTTVVEGVDGTVVTVVRVRLDEREAAQAMITQMTMGMITKTTKDEIDTPTPIETALETREREKNKTKQKTCKRSIANQISSAAIYNLYGIGCAL